MNDTDLDKVISYLKEDRRDAVERYGSAITEQGKQTLLFMEQMKTNQEMFMGMVKTLSADFKELAVKVEENTRVTLNNEAQRDALTKCIIDMRTEMKDIAKSVVTLELNQARGEERQKAGKEGTDWLKWVIGGFIGMVVTGAAALVKGMSS